MYDNLEPEEHVNDLWEDMERLNALYEELMWDTFDTLEFTADYENDRIIIKNKTRRKNKHYFIDNSVLKDSLWKSIYSKENKISFLDMIIINI